MTRNTRQTILGEVLALAAERLPGSAGLVLHYVWPSEFPLTACGVVADGMTLIPAPEYGHTCERCTELGVALPRTRVNPHAPPP